jgi:AraC family transcriptional regulator of adaptative response/methylated-DNA-[protein]-cysteine methyltransferase
MKITVDRPLVYIATCSSVLGPMTAGFMNDRLIYLAFGRLILDVVDLVARRIEPPYVKAGGKREHAQLKAIIDMIENTNFCELKMHAIGTPFQEAVWAQLLRIPLGSTWTYKQLAEAAGAPKKFRAVAKACAANPIAVLIPCHRVVQSNGRLGGYHWGTGIKARLLEMEARQAIKLQRMGQELTPIEEWLEPQPGAEI